MRKLSKRNKELIFKAINATAFVSPADAYDAIEEELNPSQHKKIYRFLEWLYRNNKVFSITKADDLFAEYKGKKKTGKKDHKKLSERNQVLISMALKTVGINDPNLTYIYIEEQLYVDEANDIHNFLKWLHDTGKPYGPANAQQRWSEYKVYSSSQKEPENA